MAYDGSLVVVHVIIAILLHFSLATASSSLCLTKARGAANDVRDGRRGGRAVG